MPAICSSFKWIEPLFFSYRVHTQRHTDMQVIDMQTHRHTDGHEYATIIMPKPIFIRPRLIVSNKTASFRLQYAYGILQALN